MFWTLFPTTGDPFAISNGHSRLHQVAAHEDGLLEQQTQVATPHRAAYPTAFPDRASTSESLSLPVTFPPCATMALAVIERFELPASFPKGGVLYGHDDGEGVHYSQAWRESIATRRIGVTNTFTFNLRAVNPAVFHGYVDDDDESILLVDDDTGLPFDRED